MIKKLKLAVLVLIICLVVLAAVKITIDFKFSRLQPKVIYNGCYKVWAHRGYFKENQANSIESFRKAFELGAVGTELDVFYDLDSQSHVVSHNHPYSLKNGRILKLEEVFISIDKPVYYWLDFKNLKDLSESDAQMAASKLRDLLVKYDLTERTLIESTDPGNLSIISRNGLFTSYWISLKQYDNFVRFWLKAYKYKLDFILGEFSAFSLNYKYYGAKFDKAFPHIPIHLFTVNDKSTVMELIARENVKIVLSDEDYYSMNSCDKTAVP